jgi:hypothetical protein
MGWPQQARSGRQELGYTTEGWSLWGRTVRKMTLQDSTVQYSTVQNIKGQHYIAAAH